MSSDQRRGATGRARALWLVAVVAGCSSQPATSGLEPAAPKPATDRAAPAAPTSGPAAASTPGGIDACGASCDDGGCLAPRMVSLGRSHGCAVDRAGGLVCWGDNARGQLGLGPRASFASPKRVTLASGLRAVEVAAGDGVTCLRDATGAMECIGLEQSFGAAADDPAAVAAACGVGELTGDDCDPVQVAQRQRVFPSLNDFRPPVTDATAISVGLGGACVLAKKGGVRCYPMLVPGPIPSGVRGAPSPIARTADAVALVGGHERGCILRPGGRVACWNGDLVATDQPAFGAVAALASGTDGQVCAAERSGEVRCARYGGEPSPVVGPVGVTSVAVGHGMTCASSGAGAVWCWDRARQPQLVDGVDARSVVAGESFACAIGRDDALRCWGWRDAGRLGDGHAPETAAPVTVPLPGPAVAVAASYDTTCAALADGRAACWGHGFAERLETVGAALRVIDGVDRAATITAGDAHFCALADDASARCWYAQPVTLIGGPSGARIPPGTAEPVVGAHAWIDPGPGYQCGVRPGGDVACFVFRREGALPLAGIDGIARVRSASSDGFAYLKKNGEVGFASLYPALIAQDPLPAPKRGALAELSPAVAIATDGWKLCAALKSGRVSCKSLLGFGSQGGQEQPAVRRPFATDAVEIETTGAIGGQATCFRKRDGRVLCWGAHHRGLLGDGRLAELSLVPGLAEVQGVSGATGFAMGREHACAVVDGGEVRCWGYDHHGQVSGTARGHSSCPVRVLAAR